MSDILSPCAGVEFSYLNQNNLFSRPLSGVLPLGHVANFFDPYIVDQVHYVQYVLGVG